VANAGALARLRHVTAVYMLEGARITSLDDFWPVWLEAVGSDGRYFGRNLAAFASGARPDCL
jgi:hypothetical protein